MGFLDKLKKYSGYNLAKEKVVKPAWQELKDAHQIEKEDFGLLKHPIKNFHKIVHGIPSSQPKQALRPNTVHHAELTNRYRKMLAERPQLTKTMQQITNMPESPRKRALLKKVGEYHPAVTKYEQHLDNRNNFHGKIKGILEKSFHDEPFLDNLHYAARNKVHLASPEQHAEIAKRFYPKDSARQNVFAEALGRLGNIHKEALNNPKPKQKQDKADYLREARSGAMWGY